MKCFCLNFENSAELWPLVKADFARLAPSSWQLERILAVGSREALRRRIPGDLPAEEKARFLSHVDLLEEHAGAPAPFAIMEDDILIGPNSCLTITNSVAFIDRGVEWDILFTDLCITQIGQMADMAGLRRQLMTAGRTRLLDPKGTQFSSSTAYIVHPRAIPKILAATKEQGGFDLAYDVFLRNLVNAGRLNARFIFPFATSVRDKAGVENAAASDEARAEIVLSTYRRMAWRDGSVEPLLPQLADISKTLDVEAKAFAILWAAMADPSFKAR